MDPQQQPPASDPRQPYPPNDGNAPYAPPPMPNDYLQLTQQPQPIPQPSQEPVQSSAPDASQQYAVDWARAKVEAAHTNEVGQPGPTENHASSQSEQVQTAPTLPIAPVPPPTDPQPPQSTYSPPEEFETFELPGTVEATQPTAEPSNSPKLSEQSVEPITPVNNQSELTLATATAEPTRSPQTSQKIASKFGGFIKDGKLQIPHRLRPVVGAVLSGFAVFAIFNSQVIIGQVQYIINPGTGTGSNVSAALDETVGPEPLIIIPKINVSAPVVYDVTTFSEQAVQKGLERGVVHYGNTALPGQLGNNVIVGHSSNNWWASGKYKFAFVLLEKLEVGDTFILNYESKRYVYEITTKKVVDPKDTSVLSQSTEVPITTLVTCTPIGTSLNRLIIVGKQISPKPGTEISPVATAAPTANDKILPGNTPSIIDKVREWFR